MAKPKNEAPAWAPNAQATESGWADPKTGEILVSQRGLLTEADPEMVVEQPVKEPDPVPQLLTEESPVPVGDIAEEPAKEPAKPKRSRKKKPVVTDSE